MAAMKVNVSTRVNAAPDTVRDWLLSDGFLEAYRAATELVTGVEETVRTGEPDQLHRVVTFTAPTKLPWILRKYKDRAPKQVHWDEIADWDLETNRARYTIKPHAPDSWDEKYDSSGEIRISPDGDGALVEERVEFSLNVPLIGRALEKALSSEVEDLFETKMHLLRNHFR